VSAQLFGKARGEKPVILLDDVLSELDDAHQSALLTHLQDYQHPVS
jgi:recombinational DNA repair ATPase RecF